jgi:predicted RNA-binding protein YlxR (DUF448 family)
MRNPKKKLSMGKSRGHIPIRTCISCGVKRNKNDLLRLALDMNGCIVKDYSGMLSGRGAYVCSEGSCLEQVPKNKHLRKLFRVDTVIHVSDKS